MFLLVPSACGTCCAPLFTLSPYPPSQNLDHFTPDTRTWRQRYFLRDDFYKSGGPVFLCVGGEGPPLTAQVLNVRVAPPASPNPPRSLTLHSPVLQASVHCNDAVELAQQVGALLFALEHRFYGESIPTPDFSTANLVYLSAHQALADISTFHAYATSKYGLQGAAWVSFGGSYPGMLSGWARYKFPHLFTASVSSSSPVQARLDFPGYQQVVADSTAYPLVGGSPQCLGVVKEGHATVGTMLQSASGRAALTAKFNICNATALEDPNNQADWAGNGVIYIPAQENDPACTTPECNISGICAFLLDSSNGDTPLDRLAALSAVQNSNSCVDVDYYAQVAALTNTTVAGGVARIWTYQTCSEFGFYQTCEVGSQCPFTQGLSTLDTFTHLCEVAYGISADTVAQRVNFSLGYWGGRDLSGSRILFGNGRVDPWHWLGVLNSTDPAAMPTFLCDVCSHHQWTHPSQSTDAPELVQARQTVWAQVKKWLAM